MEAQTIFLAYSHRDRAWEARVSRQLQVLRHSLPSVDVWDDRGIAAGEDWLVQIEQALDRARVAILLVSESFLTSQFITSVEVRAALERRTREGLRIIPLIISPCAWTTVPWLNSLQSLPRDGKPLSLLRKPKADEVLANVAYDVAEALGGRQPVGTIADRSAHPPGGKKAVPPDRLPIGNPLPLPCFFPSVSGAAKSTLSPLDHLRVLVLLSYPCFLVSAYDFASARRSERLAMGTLVARAMEQGQTVLLDSGVYERTWLRDPRWSRARFVDTLASTPCHLSFAYDAVGRRGTLDASDVVRQLLFDRRRTEFCALFPVLHGTAEKLPALAADVATLSDTPVLAVAERELGDGLLAGARTMVAIRRSLNEVNRYPAIHVLGTGNPLSILVYSACGADSFDGLDWCQTVADRVTKRLYHSRQLDFFVDQSSYAADPELGYTTRMLTHNLEVFGEWMHELQLARREQRLRKLMADVLPAPFYHQLYEHLERGLPR